MRRMAGLGIVAAVVAVAGCKDLGVRGAANVPLDLARTRPTVFWAYQAVDPAQRKAYEGRTGDVFALGDQTFIVEYPEFAGAPAMLKPAGAVGGSAVYALRWDDAPFDGVAVAANPTKVQVAAPLFR